MAAGATARDRAALAGDGCQVTDHQDLGVPRQREIRLHRYPTRSVDLGRECPAQARARHAGAPDDGPRVDAVEVRVDTRLVDLFDAGPGLHFDPESAYSINR